MLKTGQLIENRYRILSVLGQGGMSTVYLVEDSRLDNQWVLKEFQFPPGIEPDEKTALEEHFQNEARILARLDHRGIPRVVDFFADGPRHYLVEEYVPGRTLLEIVQQGPMEQAEAVDVVLDICNVLEYIHRQGIIYRDLKPDNIVIRPDGGLKLLDFGIARVFKAEKTRDTVVVGTPGFAPPEQYGTSQTDQRSDIYSIGALMHHMLTGRDPRERPFDFEPPSKIGIKISPRLENTMMKALSLRSHDRQDTVEELRSDLEMVRDDLSAIDREMGKPRSELATRLMRIPVRGNLPGTEAVPRKANPPAPKDEEAPKQTGGAMGTMMTILYGVVLFMLLALLIEIRFRLWILIPHVVNAVIVASVIIWIWKIIQTPEDDQQDEDSDKIQEQEKNINDDRPVSDG